MNVTELAAWVGAFSGLGSLVWNVYVKMTSGPRLQCFGHTRHEGNTWASSGRYQLPADNSQEYRNQQDDSDYGIASDLRFVVEK